MPSLRILTAPEQVADHLREELIRQRWRETMPGIHRLSSELGLPRKPVEAALLLLEREGMLQSQGSGKRRKIVLPEHTSPPSMRVAILLGDINDRQTGYMVDLQHRLIETGHSVSYCLPPKGPAEGYKSRITRLVARTPADAWIVVAGSHAVLTWFVEKEVPVLALFGRRRKLPLAGVGPEKADAYTEATRRLIQLGHRRIVLLARRARRLPEPGAAEQAFLDELQANGIEPSTYNLPDWQESVEGFHARLESLFELTPPTAFIIDEVPLLVAAQQFFAFKGISAPRDISLICLDPDPAFSWCRPSMAHVHWDPTPVVRRIVNWANNIARGKDDRRQSFTKAKFIEGGTIGPAKPPFQ